MTEGAAVVGPAPRVFISSVVSEFADLRSVLRLVLRDRGIEVVVSEADDFVMHGDRSAIEECLRQIPDCDYYVLLIGLKRGAREADAASPTREEYRTALHHFMASKRPVLLTFARQAAIDSLPLTPEQARERGVDDRAHLRDFVAEVESHAFLKRFSEASVVVETCVERMNVGRTVREALIRHALVDELMWNQSQLVTGGRAGPIPFHWWVDSVRQRYPLDSTRLSASVSVRPDDRARFVGGYLHAVRQPRLRTAAAEAAIQEGVFVRYNPTAPQLEDTDERRVVKAILEAVEDLQSLYPTLRSEGEEFLVRSVGGGPTALTVHQAVILFRWHDLVADIFEHTVWLSRVLVKGERPVLPVRRDESPFGEAVTARLRAERVTPSEVRSLVLEGLSPFGDGVRLTQLGGTDEERVASLIRALRRAPQAAQFSDDQLRGVAEALLGRLGDAERQARDSTTEPLGN